MVRQALCAAVAAGLMASAAEAATVAFTLKINDQGPGTWAIYGDVTGGGGFLAYRAGMRIGPGTAIGNGTIANVSPKEVLFDSTGTLDDMMYGFSIERGINAHPAEGWADVHASQGLPYARLSPPTATLIYGFGQRSGTLPQPSEVPGYDSARSVVQPAYDKSLRIIQGTYTGVPTLAVYGWFVNSLYGFTGPTCNLFDTAGDYSNTIVMASLAVTEVLDSSAPAYVGTALVTAPNAVVSVTRSGVGAYSSQVSNVNDGAGLSQGAVNLSGAISEGPMWVMARIEGSQAAEALAQVPNLVTDGTDFAALHARYDPLFHDSNFNALFRFNNINDARAFYWNFGGLDAQLTALAAVPEPASLGLLAAGAVGLLARRKSGCR